MEINVDILNNYYEDGLLYKQVHPELPLTIWNYSEKVQFEDLWDEVLLQCRGLVTDADGNIVAKPLNKFFNIEQLESLNIEIPSEPFEVYEKLDGSLGVLFYYSDRWILTTRGSFTSDQAIYGMGIIKNKYDLSSLNKTYTYLFEIIY